MTYDLDKLDAAAAGMVGFKWHLCHELNQSGEMVYHFRNDEPPEWWKRPTEVESPQLPEIPGVRLFVRLGVPSPTRDIAAAMELLDHVVGSTYYELDNGWRLDDSGEWLPAGHTCNVVTHNRDVSATAAARELAITLACLRAEGVDTESMRSST